MIATDDYCASFSLPYCLNKRKGGVTGAETAHESIANIVSEVASDSSAYHMVSRQFIESFGQEEPNYVPPVPPSYFKIGELVNVDHNQKVVCITASNRFPVPTFVMVSQWMTSCTSESSCTSASRPFSFHITWILVFSTCCIRFYQAPSNVKNYKCSWGNYSVWVPHDGYQTFRVKCQK